MLSSRIFQGRRLLCVVMSCERHGEAQLVSDTSMCLSHQLSEIHMCISSQVSDTRMCVSHRQVSDTPGVSLAK